MWAGYMFMNTTWIQNQMVSLIILSQNRHPIDEFVSNPEILPADFVRLRNQYWEKMFAEVKKEFLSEFNTHISAEHRDYLEKIHMLRSRWVKVTCFTGQRINGRKRSLSR